MNEDEKLNQRADQLATDCRKDVGTGLITADGKQVYDGSCATLRIGCNVINKDYKRCIQNALYADEMRDYLIQKYRWNETIFSTIDWTSMEAAMDGLHGLHRVTVLKMIHFWQPTGNYVQRNEGGSRDSAKCKHCGDIDNQLHYMQCRSDAFKEARTFAWKRFCQHMKRYKHEETFLRVIWIGIQNWIYEDFFEDLPAGEEINNQEYEILVKAFQEQTNIGWKHFLVGRVAKGWSEYMAQRIPDGTMKDGLLRVFGKTLVESVWKFTLNGWKFRNEEVHGRHEPHSKRDVLSLRKCVEEIYSNLRNHISAEDEWLFRLEVKIRAGQPVPQIIGWIERILLCFDENVRKDNIVILRATHILHRVCKAATYSI